MADSVLDMLRQKQNDSVLEYLEQSRRPVEATPSGSEFGKGLASASAATAAGLRAFAANLAENFAPEWSKSQLKEINRLTASAQANAPRVTDLRQIGDASDLGDYIMGGLGQAVPSITTALVGSRLGIRGLNAAGFKLNPLAAGMVGGTVGMLPQEAGEAAVTMYNDPVAMANTTAAERTALMLGKGGINAALESIVPTMMGQKVLGGAAKLIRPGFKPAIGHAAKEMGKAGMYEAGTEAAQQVTGQAFHHLANPNEDLLAGGWDIANAAAQGFFPGAVMGGAGAGADILKSNLTQTVDKDGSVIPGGLASTLRGAKDDAHQAGVAGGERSGSAVKSLYERVSGWADRLAGSNKDVETRRSAVLDSLHPEQQRIRDLIAPYFMNEDDSGTAYASARDLILASRHSLESKDFVPLDALSMFKPGKEGEGLSTLARYMKHVGMIDNDETLGITKALKRRDIWRELLALNIDPKYGELTTAQLDDIAGNLELALMSSSGQLGFSSEYGFSGDYSEPDQVFQQGMLDLFGSKARHVREMIDKYDLHPRTGVKSQLGGLGSVGEQQDAAGVTPNDGAGTNAYGDAVGEAEDFGSDAVLDDGDTAPEFSDRLREFDSEDSDKESIKFDDLDKWFTKKEMPWSDEQLPATDTPNGQKLRAARISQNANMMRVINKQGESTLVPDDGIYLKRGNKLIDKETGAYRGPEIQRVTARTLIEKAREAAQHSDWTHDALTNPESLLSDFLRGLSMIIDAGQFTSLGTVKQGKVSGVGKEMKFEELYRINLDDKLYDTRAAALEAAKKLDKPAQTAQKGNKWVVQLTNSQEVLNKKTGTFDSIVSALKHIPDTLELMPGITVGDAKKALTAKMRKEGYTGPVSEKDLIAEGMKPRKAFKQAQFLNHPKTFTYTSRKQQPVAELAHEYSVIDQQIKALGDDASPSAAFQIKGLSALQSKLYDEIVRRLREAGEVDQGSSFVEIQDLVNDVVSHPEGWTSLDPELDFEDPKRKNYSLAQVEHKPDFSPPRNAPIIAAQVAPTESAARAYAETTGGRAVHNPETGEWMVVAGLSEKKYTEAELDSIKRVKTTKAGGYSPQSQTKTKDLRDSSKDGKDITRNKWVPEGLPQELDTFRKPKKTEANAIPEDHRTPGDYESDMLDVRKFDEFTDEPLHEDRGSVRKHKQTMGEHIAALEENLEKLIAEGAHTKHIENARRQLEALQATADEADKAVDVFKELRSQRRFGESTEPGKSEYALKEAGAPRHVVEEARKNQADRTALIDQAEGMVSKLLSAGALLGPKATPAATGKLIEEIYDAIRLNKPLDSFHVKVQRHLRRAINEARKSRRAVGEQKTSIADTINMVTDETNLTLYKAPPAEQLAVIVEFVKQVASGSLELTKEKVAKALKRAAEFDATYLGFAAEDGLRKALAKIGTKVPPKSRKKDDKLVLTPSPKQAQVEKPDVQVEKPVQTRKQPEEASKKTGAYDKPIIGDIWAQDGFKVVSTNLGGVHGRGLAKQAKDKGLINNLNKNFESSPLKNKVITLAVKGKAPETAKVPGRAFSEQVVGGNLELLKSEVRKLIQYARANPDEKFFLPYIGLGFGEGNVTDIKPVLEFAAKEPNIFMVAKDQATVASYADSFKPGVRRDATTRRGPDDSPVDQAQEEEDYSRGLKQSAQREYEAEQVDNEAPPDDYGMPTDADVASEGLTDEVEAIRQQNRKDAIKLLKSLGGIGTKELIDITGEAKRRNDVPVGLITKNPKWGLDELGRILASHGFLTEEQGEEVESVRDLLRNVLTGQGVTRLGTEDQLSLNYDVKHNKQSTIRSAFGMISDAAKTNDVLQGRMLISQALSQIDKSDVSEQQKWQAHRKILLAESELRRKAMMQDAAQHEVDMAANKQKPSAETPDGPDYAPMSDEQKKDIEELLKILAPQAAVEFANALDGNTSGAWMRNKKTGARLIRLSVYAKHPHSVAYHEALHDLFQTLREAGHEATIRVLERVATQANVKRRLAQLLDGEDAAIAQLEDPEEAAAYLFQFWALGYQGPNKPNTMIKGLGPQTESFFQRLWYAIKDVLGWLTEQDKAELIMRSFFHGKLNDPVATKAILDKVEHDAGRYDAAMRPLTKHLNKVFSTADERLRATLDKDMIEIADLFYPSLKGDSRARFFNDRDTEDNLGLFDSVFQMSNKGLAQLHDMVSEMTADDLRSAIDHLQMATKYEDIEAGHVRALVRETHKVLRKYHEYLREAGVLNYDGRPLGDLGASYFPRNWNFDMLVENGSELVADLLKHHMPDLTAIAEKAKENARAKDKDADVSGHEYTPEGVAEYILRKLTDSQGVETLTQDADGKPVGALHESGIDLGFTPLMMAVNSRTLTFLDMKHFHKYLEKDYIKTMSTYATQAVKRAEYTRRFGPSGERIRDALKNAAHSKYLEKARAQWGSDFEKKLSDIKKEAAKAGSEEAEQIAYDKLTRAAFDDFANLDKKFSAESRAYADELAPVIQALEGTLGRDISDTLRAVNSWMMTYQNWRTLPLSLFASFTDPLGIVMKGGSAKQAYKAFVRGVKEVWRTWRGSPTTGADDIEAEMAKMVGALEASALMDALGQTYSSVYMTGKAKKLNDLLFKLNGMEAWNRAMRTQAAVAGIDWLKSAIGTTDTTVLRQIEELGLKPSDLKLSLKNPGMLDMSDKKIQRALMRWINQAILRPNAAQRPVFASNPKTAIFFHLMQYTYSMQKVILGNAFHEARHGNYQPIVTLGVAYTPIAIAAMALRGLIQGGGDEPEWMKGMGPADWLVLGINRAGITGIPGSILENNLNTDIAPIEGENFVTKGIIGAADAAMGTMFPMPAVDQLLDIISPASEKTWDENAVRALPLNAMYRGWFGY